MKKIDQPCVFSGPITKKAISTITRGSFLVQLAPHSALFMHYKNAFWTKKNSFSLACDAFINSFYMDNCIASVPTLDGAQSVSEKTR